MSGLRSGIVEVPRALAELSERLAARIAGLDDALAQLRAERAADSADDEHDPEGVTLSSEWSRVAGLRSDAEGEQASVDAALARVAAGTYGTCVDCGERIPPARLAARPTASRCVACAERRGF